MGRSRLPHVPITPTIRAEHQDVDAETPETLVDPVELRRKIAAHQQELQKLLSQNAEIMREQERQRAADDRAALAASHHWPANRPMPSHYVKHRFGPWPCRNPKCRRVALDTGQQAVICTSSGKDYAWFRCKACGTAFQMPVKLV